MRAFTGVVFLLGLVAACSGTVTPTLAPTPTPTPTPMSTLDSFKAKVTSLDFQAQGPIVGSITVDTFLGPRSGPVTGTFKIKGGDSAYSISANVLGITNTIDNIVVGDWAYSRTNGGEWTRAPASGRTLQSLVDSGIVLIDEGIEAKFGQQLHRLAVANVADVDLSALGITLPGQGNLTSLSFWAETDGTPAGLSLEASLDQQILGMQAHATVTLDISIDTLSGVTITAPTD